MTTTSPREPDSIDWRNVINSGRDLLNPQRTGDPPTQEHIRRAVSSGYYGLFHALAWSNAEVLIGTPQDDRTAEAWQRVYRGLDHRQARRELRAVGRDFSTNTQNFADTFVELQDLRHSADYDPKVEFTGNQATVALATAEIVCIDYLQAAANERAYIATVTLIRGR